MPVCELLCGRFGEKARLYRAISQESPEEMAAKVAGYRAEGCTRFQLKDGGDPDVDIERIFAVAEKLQPGAPQRVDGFMSASSFARPRHSAENGGARCARGRRRITHQCHETLRRFLARARRAHARRRAGRYRHNTSANQ